MAETKTAFSEKFHLHKRINYINELRNQDIKFTKTSIDNRGDYTSGSLTYNIGDINSILDFRKAFFRVKFLYTKNDGTPIMAADIAARSSTVIENNWFYKCFSQITLTVNGTQVEVISNPGEVDSTIKNIYYPFNFNQIGDNTGWIPDKGDGSTLNFGNISTPALPDVASIKTYLDNVLIPNINPLIDPKNINIGFIERKKRYPVAVLTNLTAYEQDFPIYPLFGFFEEERVWKGTDFSFDLQIRTNYQNYIIFGSATDLSLKIVDIQVGIPKYEVTAPLLQSINNQINTDIQINYLKRTYKRLQMADNTSFYDWDLQTSDKRARYIFVWFKPSGRLGKRVNTDLNYLQSPTIAPQTAPVDGSDVAISGITAFNLVDIRLTVDGQYYPVKSPLNLNPSTNSVNDLITMYQKVSIYPQYQPYEFLNIHGIVCFDLTAQIENKAKKGLKLLLTINKNGLQGIDVHCLILEEMASIIKSDGTSIVNIPL